MANRYERLVEQLDEKGRRPLRTTRGFYRSWDYDDREKFHRGKVRESYIIGDQRLIVASDDISTFDVVHPTPVTGKGLVLTAMTLGWFDHLKPDIPNQLITANPADFPAPFSNDPRLEGRAMLVKNYQVAQEECVVRGYLVGSGWADYKANGSVCGILLPEGMIEAQQLENPIFTPATKAEEGHDQNIDIEIMIQRLSVEFPHLDPISLVHRMRQTAVDLYSAAAAFALERGVIIADTKFEFGIGQNGEIIRVDEELTPDSSRFWPLEDYIPGKNPPSLDKQPVRDYGTSIGWNRLPPAPPLPRRVRNQTKARYREAARRLLAV